MTPAIDPAQFFDTEREWQWIKHEIFAGYTDAWLKILGSRHHRLAVVDAFAGAGQFRDASGADVDGSPVIAAKRIAGYNVKNRQQQKSCRLLCIEKDSRNAARLAQTLRPFSEIATVRPGSHQEHQEEILRFAQNDPLLLFLDPIGLKQIQAADIAPLIQREGKTDVFLTIDFQIVHRTAGMLDSEGHPIADIAVANANAANLDAFFNSSAWRDIARNPIGTRPRERELLDLFFEHAVGPRYRHKNGYPVLRSPTSSPRYWLAHLCDNDKGYLLMNDLIVKIDRDLHEPASLGVTALPGLSREEMAQLDLEQAVTTLITETASGIKFGDIRRHLQPNFFGVVKQGAYSRAVKSLIQAGICSRQKTGIRAKLDDDEVIRCEAPTLV